MNLHYEENGGKKALHANPRRQYHVSQCEKHYCRANKIVLRIQVCLISRMNFDSMENCGKKALLANPKNQYRVSHCGEHDCPANSKKNGDYYEYPSLSHFTEEH